MFAGIACLPFYNAHHAKSAEPALPSRNITDSGYQKSLRAAALFHSKATCIGGISETRGTPLSSYWAPNIPSLTQQKAAPKGHFACESSQQPFPIPPSQNKKAAPKRARLFVIQSVLLSEEGACEGRLPNETSISRRVIFRSRQVLLSCLSWPQPALIQRLPGKHLHKRSSVCSQPACARHSRGDAG